MRESKNGEYDQLAHDLIAEMPELDFKLINAMLGLFWFKKRRGIENLDLKDNKIVIYL